MRPPTWPLVWCAAAWDGPRLLPNLATASSPATPPPCRLVVVWLLLLLFHLVVLGGREGIFGWMP